jgi:Phytanoyl-CoA dioxygenase (PhyH)
MEAVMPSEENVDHYIDSLRVLGYAKLEGVFTQPAIAEARLIVQSLCDKGDVAPIPEGTVIASLQNKAPQLLSFLEQPLIESVLMATLNDPYYGQIPSHLPNYIVSELIARSSGSNKQRLHIDSWIPAPGPRTWMVQLAIALEKRGIEEGCTVVVPGSHVRGEYTNREFRDVVPVPLEAGDAAIWDSRLWHGTLPRTSRTPGWALISTLQMWWVKQRYNVTSSLPENIFSCLTDKQKALLGFCSLPPYDEFAGNCKKGYSDLVKIRPSRNS